MLTNVQTLILIAVLTLSVALTRFFPFVLFRNAEQLPAFVQYLGKVLPAAMMGLLVVYCFRDLDYSNMRVVLPAAAASAVVIGLHLWKRKTILSIAAGTAVYMVLIRLL